MSLSQSKKGTSLLIVLVKQRIMERKGNDREKKKRRVTAKAFIGWYEDIAE